MVTIPSAPVHVVVSVILAPSTSFRVPHDADKETVCDVASEECHNTWSHVFMFEFAPVISDVIATVPSLFGSVYVLATVFVLVNQEVIVLAAFLIFNLNSVSPAYPPLVSFPLVSCFRFRAVCCAVDTGLFASEVLSAFPSPT